MKLALWLRSREFLNFLSVFLQFHNYLPLEKDMALHLNKLEYLSPKDALCQVWLKLAQRFWRNFLKFCQSNFGSLFFCFHGKRHGHSFQQTRVPINVFLQFHNYLLLEKDMALHLNKLESLSPKDVLCQVWLKLAQWFLRRRWGKMS